jgi:hypothetical protein
MSPLWRPRGPPMGKALRVAVLGGLLWLLLGRRRRTHDAPSRAVVGFADGSSETVPPTAFEHEALVVAAEEALAP